MQHILLVDDDLSFRRSLMIQLEFEGYSVTEAESASLGLAYLQKHYSNDKCPDIVITDVRMPDMTGGEFVMRLQKQFSDIPVIVISAFDLPEELAGYPFFKKPCKIQDLAKTVNKLVTEQSLRTGEG